MVTLSPVVTSAEATPKVAFSAITVSGESLLINGDVLSRRRFVSGDRENNECIIFDITFEKKDNILEIRFLGKSFYRYMVRNLVGMMIEVGRGKEDISKVKDMLKAKTIKHGFTAPAAGLYLEKIYY